MGKVLCFKHPDKEIEYFCKICHQIVCPKCMFTEHNGHDLAQLEDVTAIIKQNIWFSIAVKVVFVALAILGWATLWMAVAADMGASLIVIANGLRALRVRA